MRKVLLLLVSLALVSSAHAQTPAPQQGCSTAAEDAPVFDESEPNVPPMAYDVTVPVAFHVITDPFSPGVGNVGDAVLQQQIAVLNDRYARAGYDIRFRLATITRTQNALWKGIGSDERWTGEAKSELHLDPARVLNVYVADAAGDNYARFPWEMSGESDYRNGVLLDYRVLPGQGEIITAQLGGQTLTAPKDHGETLAHEIGHFFGLLHTFREGSKFELCKESSP